MRNSSGCYIIISSYFLARFFIIISRLELKVLPNKLKSFVSVSRYCDKMTDMSDLEALKQRQQTLNQERSKVEENLRGMGGG